MTTIGFSAFLKMICSNDRPALTQIRQRLMPSTGGYDYHRGMRLRAQQFLSGAMSYEDVIASTASINNSSERVSAANALENLRAWRQSNPGEITPASDAIYTSPNGFFSIRYTPDFALRVGNELIAFHIYNNITPHLVQHQVYSALSLIFQTYSNAAGAPDDVSVLSLREARDYRLREQPNYLPMGEQLATRVENLFVRAREQLSNDSNTENRRPDNSRRPST